MGKTCFIISTIGDEDSDPRKIADIKFEYFFKPVLEDLKYTVIRADKEYSAGSISRKIVDRIIKSEIVIADISDLNPNVFYELAIRNAVNKPLIIIKSLKQDPPFDIQDTRAISVDMTDPTIWKPAMDQLKKQIQEAERNTKEASHSILSDFTFKIDANKQTDPQEEILRRLKDLESEIRDTRTKQYIELEKPESANFPYIKPLKLLPLPRILYCKGCTNMLLIDIPKRLTEKNEDGEFGVSQICSNCKTLNFYTKNQLDSKP